MSKQQRSLRLFSALKNVFEVPASHGQAVASGLGRGHAHLWLSSSRVPAWQQALQLSSRQQAAGFSSCSRQAGAAATAAWYGHAVRRLMSTVATDAATAAKAGGAAAAAAAASQAASPSLALSRGLPDSARKALAWWLGGCSAWVFSMVVLGGFTRLTRSGLSMTDWKFTGERPPITQEEWLAEFAKYQASPEFRLAHSHMDVEEFKFIYFMEWAHRMWGRFLGVAFAVPAAYFAARGHINGPLGRRLALLFMMGGAQGLVGWWMVRSGLQEPENKHAVPRVSPYRLAAHLTSAFAIYATLVWTTLDLARPAPVLSAFAAKASDAAHAAIAAAAKQQAAAGAALRARVLPLSLLVGITAISGAFVAGMDAGRAFNTFPLMNGQLIPDDYWGLSGIRNAFENTAAVQLHHRALALSTLAAVTAVWAAGRKMPLPGPARTALNVTMAFTAAQVTLGITTLLTYVPVSLGAAHQAGALALFTAVLTLMHSVRPASPSAAALAVSRLAQPVAVLATAAIATAVTQMK
uniref:Uncharacterized protein n=1 Tax=Tetradesmus obliquus TaxID=3088 RepID=A0A383VMG5_TETOB|eukprot:jgi/Sobl393_1/4216/SZX65606.1